MPHQSRRAEMGEGAALAERLAGSTDGASVVDEQVREVEPVLARYEVHQVSLDLHRVPVSSPAKAVGQANIMRIDCVALDNAEGVAQYHIRCFARHAGQAEQARHGTRHLAAEIGDDFL